MNEPKECTRCLDNKKYISKIEGCAVTYSECDCEQWAKEVEEKIEAYSKELHTWDNYWIICPYCGHKHDDAREYFEHDNNDESELECSTCGNKSKIILHFNVRYETEKTEQPKAAIEAAEGEGK